ncbi:unnamed protein product, partial [marine sediment metagenome]
PVPPLPDVESVVTIPQAAESVRTKAATPTAGQRIAA